MPLRQLHTLVETDLGYARGALAGQRHVVAGALLSELRCRETPLEAHAYMFAAPTISQAACKATCQDKSGRSSDPVFSQCRLQPSEAGGYCKQHADGKFTSPCDWEPLTFFPGMSEKALAAAWKCACSRHRRCHVGVSSSTPPGGGGVVIDPQDAVAHGVEPRLQREFVALTQAEQEASQLRCFSEVPTALPPHPCMLCNSAFGSAEDFRAHVTDAHHGMRHYRQRLAYLCEQFEAVGQVKPQLWRHALEAYAEEYVTGSSDWSCHSVGWSPSLTGSLPWTRVEGHGQPTLRQYSDCAVRIAKWLCSRCHPWVVPAVGVPLAELRAEGMRIVGDVAPP